MESSVSEGSTSSLSSSVMSYKNRTITKTNIIFMTILTIHLTFLSHWLKTCCGLIMETYATGLNFHNLGVGRMEAADERDYMCELSLIS